jgi:iron complex transport system permease protein
MSLNKIIGSERIIFFILFILLIGFFLLDLFLGSIHIPFSEILKTITTGKSSSNEWKVIILDFRFPKAIAAVLAGMALSVSELQMQTIFRNPLAGPDVLGINSGASLGVAILLLGMSAFASFQISSVLGNGAIVIAGCVGAAAALVLIMIVSYRVRDIMTILILGILIGAAISSVVSILQYFGNESVLKSFVIWTLGSLGQISKAQLFILGPCIIAGLLIAFLSIKKLDVLLLGEQYAKTLGLNIKVSRIIVFTSTSVLAGSTTAFCGPIAFIGIAVPHISRIVFKTSKHSVLLLASILIGAIVLLISDMISQLPGTGFTIPINSVTAIIGIPVIIWIIIQNRKKPDLR